MEPAKVRNRGKHILIALVGTVITILFITSIVLITIGYLNPFGSVGLGILGGGCVVFFSAVLFLCVSSIWIKNKYYADESDYKEKLVGRSTEDISLLKPTSHIISSEHLEMRSGMNDIQGDKNNPVPLYSVSTAYSSGSSSLFPIPEKLMPYNCQEEDIAGATDSDVFSSSLTALQYGDKKSQQRLEPAKNSTDLLTGDYNGQNERKGKEEQKRQHAKKTAHNNKKYVSDLPRQRMPVVMDSSYCVPHGNSDKQLEIPPTDVQSAKTKETHSSTNKDLWDRNKKLCPVDTSTTTAAASQHNDCKGSSNQDRAPGKINKSNVIKIVQIADGQECSVNESDPVMQNTTRDYKQGILRKEFITVPAGNLVHKKHNSNEGTGKSNQDRTAIPLQGSSPQSKLDQSANVSVTSHVTRAEDSRGKILITRKNVKPTTKTDQ